MDINWNIHLSRMTLYVKVSFKIDFRIRVLKLHSKEKKKKKKKNIA